jgi:tetratricopeptide (TPR) repeat protein
MHKFLIVLSILVFTTCSHNASTKTKADRLYDNGRFQKAIMLYTNVLRTDSLNAEVLFNIGVCYNKVKNYNMAEKFYYKVIPLNYRKADLFFNMGINATCMFKDSLAIEFFMKALIENPNDSEAINEIQQCKVRLGENGYEIF